MTDDETKELFSPDEPATDPGAAPIDVSTPEGDTGATGEPREKPIDPYKLKDITVPPGLRAKIIEYSRQLEPQEFPEDTMPPNKVVATCGTTADKGPTATPASETELTSVAGTGGSPPADTTPEAPTADSVRPVGHTSAPRRSMASARAIVATLTLVTIAALLVVALIREKPRSQPTQMGPAAPVLEPSAKHEVSAPSRDLGIDAPRRPTSTAAVVASAPSPSTSEPAAMREQPPRKSQPPSSSKPLPKPAGQPDPRGTRQKSGPTPAENPDDDPLGRPFSPPPK